MINTTDMKNNSISPNKTTIKEAAKIVEDFTKRKPKRGYIGKKIYLISLGGLDGLIAIEKDTNKPYIFNPLDMPANEFNQMTENYIDLEDDIP